MELISRCHHLKITLYEFSFFIFTHNMIYYFNIGSNLGNKADNLHQAITLLEKALSSKASVSTIIESKAWGFESENTFMNIGAAIESDIAPLDMLKLTQQIEHDLGSHSHRNDDGSYCDRLVDIDIIAIDNLVIDTPELTIPHPRMHLRDFVLRPMAELAPQWTHPLLHDSTNKNT